MRQSWTHPIRIGSLVRAQRLSAGVAPSHHRWDRSRKVEDLLLHSAGAQPTGDVHNGFYTVLLGIQEGLFEVLKEALQDGRHPTIYFGGHSLGGARRPCSASAPALPCLCPHDGGPYLPHSPQSGPRPLFPPPPQGPWPPSLPSTSPSTWTAAWAPSRTCLCRPSRASACTVSGPRGLATRRSPRYAPAALLCATVRAAPRTREGKAHRTAGARCGGAMVRLPPAAARCRPLHPDSLKRDSPTDIWPRRASPST